MTRRNKICVLFSLVTIYCFPLAAQKIDLNKYVVISVDLKYSNGFEGIKTYYWIVPIDSVKSPEFDFYPLFLTGVSKNNLDRCCAGKEIDPYVMTNEDSIQDLGDAYNKEFEQLHGYLQNHRKRLLRITKNWVLADKKEVITFYATALNGVFCSSQYSKTGIQRWGYSGKVYVPVSSFSIIDDFWQSEKAKLILQEDLSKIAFDIIRF